MRLDLLQNALEGPVGRERELEQRGAGAVESVVMAIDDARHGETAAKIDDLGRRADQIGDGVGRPIRPNLPP